MKQKDACCSLCAKELRKVCHTVKPVCAPLTWVDGNKPCKEKLYLDMKKSSCGLEYRDYNKVLAEHIKDSGYSIEQLLALDYRTRAIGAMLLAQIPKLEICKLLNLSKSQANRILAGNKPE